jgi:phosphoglycerate dehydrogenase-like enzyme
LDRAKDYWDPLPVQGQGGGESGRSAAVDVFDQEPLPPDHPFRTLPNLLATPHIGYVSRGLYTRFYQDTVENIRRWLDVQALG